MPTTFFAFSITARTDCNACAVKELKHKKNTFLNFYSVEEARFYAEQLTREAVSAIKRYPDSDALVSLAQWLLARDK